MIILAAVGHAVLELEVVDQVVIRVNGRGFVVLIRN